MTAMVEADDDERDEMVHRNGVAAVLHTVAAGMESPAGLGDTMPLVERAFALVDLCGFTRFIAARASTPPSPSSTASGH
jgi:hypothetical protein